MNTKTFWTKDLWIYCRRVNQLAIPLALILAALIGAYSLSKDSVSSVMEKAKAKYEVTRGQLDEALSDAPAAASVGEGARFGKAKAAKEGGARFSLIPSANAAEPVGQKLIKTGSIQVRVADPTQARAFLKKTLPGFKAWIAGEDEGKTSGSDEMSFTIRVPAEKFDALVDAILGGGYELGRKTIRTQDVTEQFIDTETRLKNKKILIEKYRALLTRAQKTKDALEINEHLEQIVSEVESLEGQMKVLSNQIAYSTLELSMSKILLPTETHERTLLQDFKLSLNEGLQSLRGNILWGFSLWPYLIFLGFAWFTLKRMRRRKLA